MFLSEVENGTVLFAPVATGNGLWTVEAVCTGGRTFRLVEEFGPRGACIEANRLTRSLSRHPPHQFAADPAWLEITAN